MTPTSPEGVCPDCHRYRFGFDHRCPPAWEVRAVEKGEEASAAASSGAVFWTKVRAVDDEAAAEEFTEQYEDSYAEYPVAQGQEKLVVLVRPAGSVDPTRVTRFEVEGEYVRNYTAYKLPDAE